MIRRTSIEVYRQIEAEGLLSRLRFEVYSALYKEKEPTSALELYNKYFKNTHRDHSITPRFSELENTGVIQSVGERPCGVSGRNVCVWVTTDNLPIKFEKPVKIKCEHCKGKGYHSEQQGKLL